MAYRERRQDGAQKMSDDFEDHCWKDIVTPDILEIYSAYKRKTFVGPAPALLAIDLYELVYRGGAQPPARQDCRSFIRPATPAMKAARISSAPPNARSRRSTPPITPSVRNSNRNPATSSSPSSAPAPSTARRFRRI
jgi:hypothetical protein